MWFVVLLSPILHSGGLPFIFVSLFMEHTVFILDCSGLCTAAVKNATFVN